MQGYLNYVYLSRYQIRSSTLSARPDKEYLGARPDKEYLGVWPDK